MPTAADAAAGDAVSGPGWTKTGPGPDPPSMGATRFATVLRPGLLTTIQDAGRWGYQDVGVSVSGPMDQVAQRLANALLGNARDAATLEATWLGPELRMEQETRVAVAGADLHATLDGADVPLYVPVRCRAGSVLRFGDRRSGARAYVAFRWRRRGAARAREPCYARPERPGWDRGPSLESRRSRPPSAIHGRTPRLTTWNPRWSAQAPGQDHWWRLPRQTFRSAQQAARVFGCCQARRRSTSPHPRWRHSRARGTPFRPNRTAWAIAFLEVRRCRAPPAVT